jgi:hypothetical protein
LYTEPDCENRTFNFGVFAVTEREKTEIEVGWFKKAAITAVIVVLLATIAAWFIGRPLSVVDFAKCFIAILVGMVGIHYVIATTENNDDWIAMFLLGIVCTGCLFAGAFLFPGLSMREVQHASAERIRDFATSVEPTQPSAQGNVQSQTVQPQVPVQNAQPQAPVQQLPAVQPSLPVVPAQTVPEPRLPAVTGITYNGTSVTFPNDDLAYFYRLNDLSQYQELKSDSVIQADAIYVIGKKNGLRVTEVTPVYKTK